MKTLDEKETWQAVLGEMEVVFSQANFSTWFKDTFILDLQKEEIIIGVPNGFTQEWLENKYHGQILTALQKMHPAVKSVKYTIASSKAQPLPRIEAVHPQAPQSPSSW